MSEMTDDARCEKCDCEITTGLQFSLCPYGDECALWDKTIDAETQLSMWRMWAGQARNAFMQQREELTAAQEREKAAEARCAELREALSELVLCMKGGFPKTHPYELVNAKAALAKESTNG